MPWNAKEKLKCMTSNRMADPLPRGTDMDYVQCFEASARIEMEIRRRGPSPHLLLRRAMAAMALGNYVTALDAARDAVTACPKEPEAHYQEGLAWLWIGRVQVGAATMAPGTPAITKRPLETVLANAYDAFCAASACGRADGDADAAAAWLEVVMESEDSVAHLRGEAAVPV
jgi:hypothetical protein